MPGSIGSSARMYLTFIVSSIMLFSIFPSFSMISDGDIVDVTPGFEDILGVDKEILASRNLGHELDDTYLNIGALRVNIERPVNSSGLPEQGFREGQYILRSNGPISTIQSILPSNSKIIELISSDTLLIEFEYRSEVQDNYQKDLIIYPFHSSMVIEGQFLLNLLDIEDDPRTFQVVVGSYQTWTKERIETLSMNWDKDPIPLDPWNLLVNSDRDGIARTSLSPLVSHISSMTIEGLDNDIAADIIDVLEVWSISGLDGSDQIIGVADTGLDTGQNSTMHPDMNGRIGSVYTYGRPGNWSDPDIHVWDSSTGSWSYKGGHGTHVVGSVLGNGSASNGSYSGMAPNASLVMQSTMASSGSLSIPAYNTLFGDAYSSGARIHTNSWSSRSSYANYSWRSWQIDNYIWNHKDLLVLFSAGNKGANGRYSLSTQASAKNVVAVGASESYRPLISSWANDISQMADFSSQGYTWGDERIKPDVVAPGTYILSTRASTISDFWNHYWGSNSTYTGINSNYAFMGGTSMSTPLVAGMSALIRQYFQEMGNLDAPSAALLKAAIINGARPLNGDWSSIPNRLEGWGRVNLSNSLAIEGSNAGDLFFEDNSTGLTTGASHSSDYYLSGNGSDMIITLTWTDPPGSNTSTEKLINDLDLVVTAPNGTVYYGNDLVHPFNSSFDRKNTVERIRIPSASPGPYNVTIKGYSVLQGPQPYAFVATGDLLSEKGTLGFESDIVPADGSGTRIWLTDTNLTGEERVTVLVNSTTDPTSEEIELVELVEKGGGTGVFTGFVNITIGSPGVGEVQVGGDEVVTVRFQEKYPSRTLEASTLALLVPSINNISFDPKGSTLTYLDPLVVTINATVFREVSFSVMGLPSITNIKARDDGILPDEVPWDGLYKGMIFIPDNIKGNFTIRGSVYREGLGSVELDSSDIVRIDTDIPRRPNNITVEAVPSGNSLQIGWDSPDGPEIVSHIIYRANESSIGSGIPGIFIKIGNTPDNRTDFTDIGLIDGNIYFYSISALNGIGLVSTFSEYTLGTPYDLQAPWVIWNGPDNGDVLTGTVDLDISIEEDAEQIILQGSLDSDGDGIPGSIWSDLEVLSNDGPIFKWDTIGLPSQIWEENDLFLRIRVVDEAGNINVTPPLVHVIVDNTPPGSIEVLSDIKITLNDPVYPLLGKTEPGSTLVVIKEGKPYLTSLVKEDGIFEESVPLDPGVNIFTLEVYDEEGNGPLEHPASLYIVRDEVPPVPDIKWTDNLTSERTKLTAEESLDPGPISDLTGISHFHWSIEFDDLLQEFDGRDISFEPKVTRNLSCGPSDLRQCWESSDKGDRSKDNRRYHTSSRTDRGYHVG